MKFFSTKVSQIKAERRRLSRSVEGSFEVPSQKLSPLCDTCNTLLQEFPNIEYGKPILYTAVSLEERAAANCHLCLTFLSLIPGYMSRPETHGQLKPQAKGDVRYFRGSTVNQEPRIKFVTSGISEVLRFFPQLETAISNEQSELWDGWLERSTASDSAMSHANSWLGNCSAHPQCQPEVTSDAYAAFLPTRLIAIDKDSATTLRLCEGKDLAENTVYTTLSHCWGESPSLMLQTDTIEVMKQAVEFELLPKTFQDAVLTTHRLGLYFIWIDALCIIQDSVEDWKRESGRMGIVYSSSFCNLCAAASIDGSGGLFKRRFVPPDVRLQFRPTIGGTLRTYRPFNAMLLRQEVTDSPLNQRAWAFQERVLSRRNLHFGNGQMFWECRKSTACEAFPDEIPRDMWDSENKAGFLSTLRYKQTENLKLSAKPSVKVHDWMARVFDDWCELLKAYSSGALTYQTDRLVAISGLAFLVNKLFDSVGLFEHFKLPDKFDFTASNQPYLAGIWNYNIVPQLLWFTINPRSTRTVVSEYVAPSWSWASVDGKIYHGVDRFDHQLKGPINLVKITSMTTTLLNSLEPFGQVSSGTLIVNGKLSKATYILTGKERRGNKGVVVRGTSCDYDTWFGWDCEVAKIGDFLAPGNVIYLLPIRVTSSLIGEPRHVRDIVQCMDIPWTEQTKSRLPSRSNVSSCLQGIVLKAIDDPEDRPFDRNRYTLPSKFRRVGKWEMEASASDHLQKDIGILERQISKELESGSSSRSWIYPAYDITII